MADRGRYNRDDKSPLIPVAELLDASKHGDENEAEREQQVLAEALLNKKPRPGQSPFAVGTADQPAVVAQPGRLAPRVLGVAATVAMLAGALIATQAFNGANDHGSVASGPEHIRGAKVFRPDVIRASLNTGGDSDVPRPEAWEPADGTDPGQAGAGAQNGSGGAGSGELADGAPMADPAAPGQQSAPGQQGRPGGAAPTTNGGLLPNLPLPQLPPLLPGPATTTTNGGSGGSASGGLLGPILDPLDPITDPILGPILGFYAAAPQEPATAFGLLDTNVQEGTVDDFARSWGDVRSTDVENATRDGDNAFIVQVSMLRFDGSRMLTRQRIVVGNGPRPKIVDAQLLSVSLR